MPRRGCRTWLWTRARWPGLLQRSGGAEAAQLGINLEWISFGRRDFTAPYSR
jgi:hypothetical protein